MTAIEAIWLDRIYPPLVTLWVFLSQVLSQDHSCRAAVVRLIAHRVSRGQSSCSAETGAYCQARKRLPEKFFPDVARHTGQALDNSTEERWLWKGRRVLPGCVERKTSKMMQRDLERARKDWIGEAKAPSEKKRREKSDFLKYCDSAGLYADFHSNRHTFISNLTLSGASPKVAQVLARHSDINLALTLSARRWETF